MADTGDRTILRARLPTTCAARWPLLKELVRPRRSLLALGFVLMIINRLCGMVLPVSTKFLIDNVIGKHNAAPAGAAGAARCSPPR